MGSIEIANILKCLKETYDKYKKVDDMVFTTFDFDPCFFADHIVSYLMGNEHEGISKIGELNAANSWINDNKVCVYYDSSGLQSNGETILTIPVYPVHISTGVFHPKVIAIYGQSNKANRKMAHLLVSSANLTVNGYGRNVECFTAIEVKSKKVAISLRDFLIALRDTNNNHEKGQFQGFIDFLNSNSFDDNDSIEFFWNLKGRMSKKYWLETYLAQMPMDYTQVVSPYFDEQNLSERIKNTVSKPICFLLSKDNGFYNIKQEIYEELSQNDDVKFFQLIADRRRPERFVHAKMIKKGQTVIIGSYNFTEAALRAKNAEAAIIYNRTRSFYFDYDNCIDKAAFIDDVDSIVNRDTCKSKSVFFVTVTADWSTKKLTINFDANDTSKKNYKIVIGNNTIDIVDSITVKEIYSDNLDHELLVHKHYILFESGKQIFTGRINELNWDLYRPELSCRDLYEVLSEWYQIDEKHKDKLPIHYELDSVSEENDVYNAASTRIDSDKDVFDNYYYMSSAMRRMLSAIDNANGEDKGLYAIFWISAGSMKRLLDFIEKEIDEGEKNKIDFANLWMIMLFLDLAEKRLPNKIETIPNYADEKQQYREQLNNCILKCRNELYRLSKKKRQFGKFIKWINNEFDKELKCSNI